LIFFGEVRHINVQDCTDFIGNFAEAFEVNLARDRRPTGDNHRGLVLDGQRLDLIVINQVRIFRHAVLNGVKPLARQVRPRAVGQVTTRGEVHTQHGIAGFDRREHHGLVCLRP